MSVSRNISSGPVTVEQSPIQCSVSSSARSSPGAMSTLSCRVAQLVPLSNSQSSFQARRPASMSTHTTSSSWVKWPRNRGFQESVRTASRSFWGAASIFSIACGQSVTRVNIQCSLYARSPPRMSTSRAISSRLTTGTNRLSQVSVRMASRSDWGAASPFAWM